MDSLIDSGNAGGTRIIATHHPMASHMPARGKKLARLYHFDQSTIEDVDYLGKIFGTKERGIATAVTVLSNLLRGAPGNEAVKSARKSASTTGKRPARQGRV